MTNITTSILRKELKYELSKYDFKLKGTNFYKIKNDIAFCLNLQHPGLYHLEVFIIPLYMPIYSINFNFSINRQIVLKRDDIAQPDFFKNLLDSTVFPFFETISTPEKIVSILSQYETYFSCPAICSNILYAYSALKTSDRKSFDAAIYRARKSLEYPSYFFQSVLDAYSKQIESLEIIASTSAEERVTYFSNNIENTFQSCFGKNPK